MASRNDLRLLGKKPMISVGAAVSNRERLMLRNDVTKGRAAPAPNPSITCCESAATNSVPFCTPR
eukprot:CAMPEP_0183371558 /NCGR_PEP_ID=MMETSP0164_2-20130417/105768_1 /TAXON_ID=221442 /ORGANISM="Coccolithus pelagicus ssp braarudi, Strain PLY182g" /LENGTH=64 /DNA_ID=CAMNT_0025548123 /DNA_START=284 /DNA_END=475 /DNA_ORIENTATION=-